MVDSWGNVYGTTWGGTGYCIGCPLGAPIYKLHNTDSGWLFGIVARLPEDTSTGLIHDANGVLYGTGIPAGGQGDVFELRPSPGPRFQLFGRLTENTLYQLNGDDGTSPNDLTMDSQGNLYGTTTWGGR
jgi:hypothetical protein